MNELNQDKVHDLLDFYTNSVQISASIYEITMEFGLTTPKKDHVESRKLVRIRMSPQQAKAFSVVLNRHLEIYGERFQELRLPEDLMRSLSGEQIGETTDERSYSAHSE